jgi:hypothetical protein
MQGKRETGKPLAKRVRAADIQLRTKNKELEDDGGADGTRTRDLRRDRPAF